jgi:catechol-2,3-dioxygenase
MGGTPRFDFVKLSVKDLDAQAHFSTAVLGLRSIHRADAGATMPAAARPGIFFKEALRYACSAS